MCGSYRRGNAILGNTQTIKTKQCNSLSLYNKLFIILFTLFNVCRKITQSELSMYSILRLYYNSVVFENLTVKPPNRIKPIAFISLVQGVAIV